MLVRYQEQKKEQKYKWTFLGENATGRVIVPEMTVMMHSSILAVPPSSTNNLYLRFRRIEKAVCQEILDRMAFVKMGAIFLWALIPDHTPNLVERWDLDGITVAKRDLKIEDMHIQTLYVGSIELNYYDAYSGT
jgi:hypothetical protein